MTGFGAALLTGMALGGLWGAAGFPAASENSEGLGAALGAAAQDGGGPTTAVTEAGPEDAERLFSCSWISVKLIAAGNDGR
jgi:hypothetical protein